MKTQRFEKWFANDEERRELINSPSPRRRRKFPTMKVLIGLSVLCAFALTAVSLAKISSKSDSKKPVKGRHSAHYLESSHETITVGNWDSLFGTNIGKPANGANNESMFNCPEVLHPDTARMIDDYRDVVDRIIAFVTDNQKGETWRQLADFVDAHGPRQAGTQALEGAIDDRIAYFKNIINPDNVHTEPVEIPAWQRGETEVVLLNAWAGNRNKTLSVLSLGYSVGTPTPGGFVADVVVVKSFDDLEARQDVAGKIVVFNQDYVSYGETVAYRSAGASKAAAKGAVAALIRSITDYSLYTPHTGMMQYSGNATKVPAICITVEDAELMWRKQQRGERLQVFIRSTAHQFDNVHSRNLVAELPGTSNPQEFVIVSGHIDSWDVGQGAMDDGGGAAISWRALEVLKTMGLQARRTIRTVLFTSEEMGAIGGQAYFNAHKANASNAQFILESDIGTFTPIGISSGIKNAQAVCIIERTLKLFESINATTLDPQDDGPDIGSWFGLGVPGGSLYNQNDKYFRYHHTNADTMHMMDPIAMDKATALWAGVAYVFADMEARIPHDPTQANSLQADPVGMV